MTKLSHRNINLESTDFADMVRLLAKFYGEGNHDWTLGRLYAWRYGLWTPESRDPKLFSKSAELFLDECEQLQGFVVIEECGGDVAAVFAPNDEQVLEEIAHFLASCGNYGQAYSIYCSECNSWIAKWFRNHGYDNVNYADTTFEYQAKDIVLPKVSLPEGYSMTDQSLYLDLERVERFRHLAFNPESNFNDEVAWAYQYSRKNPFIQKDLCILLLNENKEPVSSCIGYYDTVNADMEVEVVCTKKEEEGRGFAKAVIAECIRRGLELGVKTCSISGWNEMTRHIYSSFGENKKNEKVCLKKV